MTNTAAVSPAVYRDAYVLAWRDGRLLLQERHHSVYRGGDWGVPSGKVELGETYADAAVRELTEETGLTPSGGVSFRHLMNRVVVGGDHWIGVYFEIAVSGEPQLLEPQKHVNLRWADPSDLPSRVTDYVAHAVSSIKAGTAYSEWYE